jgi:hypothetical protein
VYLTALLIVRPYIRQANDRFHLLIETELILLILSGYVIQQDGTPATGSTFDVLTSVLYSYFRYVSLNDWLVCTIDIINWCLCISFTLFHQRRHYLHSCCVSTRTTRSYQTSTARSVDAQPQAIYSRPIWEWFNHCNWTNNIQYWISFTLSTNSHFISSALIVIANVHILISHINLTYSCCTSYLLHYYWTPNSKVKSLCILLSPITPSSSFRATGGSHSFALPSSVVGLVTQSLYSFFLYFVVSSSFHSLCSSSSYVISLLFHFIFN